MALAKKPLANDPEKGPRSQMIGFSIQEHCGNYSLESGAPMTIDGRKAFLSPCHGTEQVLHHVTACLRLSLCPETPSEVGNAPAQYLGT